MTPLHIRLLLHFYITPLPFDMPSDCASEYTCDLIRLGLIEKSDSRENGYKVTQKGEAHINGICALDFPQWVSPIFDTRK